MKAYIFLANGFEETEAIAPIDVMRRAGIDVTIVSVTGDKMVTSSHNVTVLADKLFDELDYADVKLLVLPGGMPGTTNLAAHKGLADLLVRSAAKDIILGAICAAPSVFGQLGLLKGQKATCYPGFEDKLTGAEVMKDQVVVSGKFVTSCGAGPAMKFGLALVAQVMGADFAENLARKMEFV